MLCRPVWVCEVIRSCSDDVRNAILMLVSLCPWWHVLLGHFMLQHLRTIAPYKVLRHGTFPTKMLPRTLTWWLDFWCLGSCKARCASWPDLDYGRKQWNSFYENGHGMVLPSSCTIAHNQTCTPGGSGTLTHVSVYSTQFHCYVSYYSGTSNEIRLSTHYVTKGCLVSSIFDKNVLQGLMDLTWQSWLNSRGLHSDCDWLIHAMPLCLHLKPFEPHIRQVLSSCKVQFASCIQDSSRRSNCKSNLLSHVSRCFISRHIRLAGQRWTPFQSAVDVWIGS